MKENSSLKINSVKQWLRTDWTQTKKKKKKMEVGPNGILGFMWHISDASLLRQSVVRVVTLLKWSHFLKAHMV